MKKVSKIFNTVTQVLLSVQNVRVPHDINIRRRNCDGDLWSDFVEGNEHPVSPLRFVATCRQPFAIFPGNPRHNQAQIKGWKGRSALDGIHALLTSS